jgi:hypothetical protein
LSKGGNGVRNHFALVTAAAILEDKGRLVRGQATGINVQVLMDVAEMIRNEDGG